MIIETLKNLSFELSGQLVGRVISGVASLFIAYTLSVSGLGEFAIVISIASFANVIATLIQSFVSRDVAASEGKAQKRIISTILFGTATLAGASALFIMFTTGFFGRWIGVGGEMIFYVATLSPIYLFFQSIYQIFRRVFQGLEDFKTSSIISILQSVSYFSLVISFYLLGYLEVLTVLVASLLSFAMQDMMALIILRNNLSLKFDLEWYKSRVREGFTLLPSSIAKRAKGAGVNLILGGITGSTVPVGYLKFTKSIIPLTRLIPNLLTQVLYPTISKFRGIKNKISDILTKYIRYSFPYQLIATSVGILFFEEALIVLGLEKYLGAHLIFSLLLISQLLAVAGRLNRKILFALEKTEKVTISDLIGYLSFFITLPLVLWKPLVGIGLATISMNIGLLYSFRYVSKEIEVKIPSKYIIKSLIVISFAFLEVQGIKILFANLSLKIIASVISLLSTLFVGYSYFILEEKDKKYLIKIIRQVKGKVT